MVETQGRVHVVHVLQEGEEILHLLKRDALHKTGRGRNRSVNGWGSVRLRRRWRRASVRNQRRNAWRQEPRRRRDILEAAQQRGTKKWGVMGGLGDRGVRRSGLETESRTDG